MRTALALLGVGLLPLAVQADEPKKEQPTSFEIPYRLTVPKHIMVRAKINGKGPYNFILDTGAPALFVSTKLCKNLGIEPGKDHWGTFDRFEIEGGLVIEKARGRIDDPFQLEGMNGLGLAGAELHGIIGYNILAKHRMEIDFTRDKMVWTPLKWEPKAPRGLEGRADQGGLEVIGTLMKALGAFSGSKPEPDYTFRGFLGLELAEKEKTVIARSVLAGGPAAAAGIKPGDKIIKCKDREVFAIDDLEKQTKKLTAGGSLELTIKRDGKDIEVTIKAGEGF